jgi:hypothetical protein
MNKPPKKQGQYPAVLTEQANLVPRLSLFFPPLLFRKETLVAAGHVIHCNKNFLRWSNTQKY